MNSRPIILILTILVIELKESSNQMMNGYGAFENDFTYKVAIFAQDLYRCGGGIIDATHVVTAAHCVDIYAPSDIIIIAGVTDFDDPNGVLRSVRKIHIPDDFPIDRRSNDIAVLTLHQAVVLGEKISELLLPSQPLSYNDTVCWLTGWGLAQESWPLIYESKLSWTLSTIIPDILCECLIQRPLPIRTFCTLDAIQIARPTPVQNCQYSAPCIIRSLAMKKVGSYINRHFGELYGPRGANYAGSSIIDICNEGDSGSPIICNGVAVGVFSVRAHDVPIPANIFSSIFDHLEFINTAIID